MNRRRKSNSEKVAALSAVESLMRMRKYGVLLACQEVGISADRYYYWKKKLRKEMTENTAMPPVHQVSAAPAAAAQVQVIPPPAPVSDTQMIPPVLVSNIGAQLQGLAQRSIKELINEIKRRSVACVIGVREDDVTVHLTSKGNEEELWALHTARKDEKSYGAEKPK